MAIFKADERSKKCAEVGLGTESLLVTAQNQSISRNSVKSKIRLGKKADGSLDHVASWCGHFSVHTGNVREGQLDLVVVGKNSTCTITDFADPGDSKIKEMEQENRKILGSN